MNVCEVHGYLNCSACSLLKKRFFAKAWKRAAKRKDKAMRIGASQHAECVLKLGALKAKIEALPAVIRDLCGGQDVQPWFMEQVKKALGEHFEEDSK